MPDRSEPYDHESIPVGKTKDDQKRNAALLAEYDYSRYPAAITGYTGQDLQRIVRLDRTGDAVRTRVGPRGNYKGGMTRRGDATFVIAVCAFDPEYHTSPDHRKFDIVVYESKDAGLTWIEIARPGILGKEPSLTVCLDGALLLTAQGADYRPNAHKNGTYLCRSTDGGRTWEIAQDPRVRYPRNVFVEDTGELLFLAPGHDITESRLHVCRSSDHGRTWDIRDVPLRWAPGDESIFDEPSILRLASGKLLGALRRQLPTTRGHGFEDCVLIASDDDGGTWSTPRRFTNIAEVQPSLLQLRDGRLLCSYTNYHLPFGPCAIVSEDQGETWDLDHPFQLATSAGECTGWAVTIELDDNSLLTSYANTPYLNEDQPTTCEVVRWRLE